VGGASLVVVLVLPGVITILGRPYHAISGSAAPAVMGAIVTPGESRDMSTVPASTPYGQLNGVSCSSRHACMAVGVRFNLSGTRQETTAELWNGRAWMLTAIRDPAGSAIAILRGVSCPTASDCLAVGAYFARTDAPALLEQWNGRSWTVLSSPELRAGYTELYGVSCASAKSCMAVGYSGSHTLAEQWNGRVWGISKTLSPGPVPQASNSTTLSAVSCIRPRSCMAVGHYLTASQRFVAIAEAWNGRVWRLIPTPAPFGRQLVGVSCSSARSCTAVGSSITRSSVSSALVERWNGARWAVQSTPAPAEPAGVSCSAVDSCMAVGAFFPQVGAWNGAGWRVLPTPRVAGNEYATSFDGVSCGSVSSCIAVGSYINSANSDSPLIEVWNGKTWAVRVFPY